MSIEINDFLASLIKQPETYKTILKEQYDVRNTITTVVKNRLCNYISSHLIMHGVLDGTRFGMKIFFHPDKSYLIFITRSKSEFHYYYCYDVEETDDNFICLKDAKELKENNWINAGDFCLNRNDIIRWF